MLNCEITSLAGIGNARAKLFEKVGIKTVSDLLFYYPRDYEDRSRIVSIFDAVEDETVCIHATVFSPVNEKRINRSLSIYSAELADESGSINASWFNNKYIKNSIIKGESYTFYGKIKRIGSKKTIENPIFEKDGKPKVNIGKIVPIYPLTAQLSLKTVQSAMLQAMKAVDEITEPLPFSMREKYNLMPLDEAIREIHFPKSFETYENARKRLVFEELLILALSMAEIRTEKVSQTNNFAIDTKYISEFKSLLPFKLTEAQDKVVSEICSDINRPFPANRLVQGDVGSGKTAVAAAAMYAAAKSGYQAALMAPTEVLASQHYESFIKMMGKELNICLLTGSMSKSEKEKAYSDILSGKAQIIIGTHAMIQESVIYKSLAIVVTDEQHRFGVNHRSIIAQKGNSPHVIVMSATPIPRTLGLIMYGDLDISVIDSLPPGRKPVATYAVGENMRPRINSFINKNVSDGRQVYIVCPLIEDENGSDLTNATDYFKNIQNNIFPHFRCALLHGRLKNSKKDEIMQNFKAGKIDILVSTTVIEVGVDVANANIMIVENAERFGLSQLHQLRGRVGRGTEQSYCILFNQNDGKVAKKRMEIMCKSNDGFYISEQDLNLRGPGEFFGTKQHGLPNFKIANLFTDINILKQAQQAALDFADGTLKATPEEEAILRKKIKNYTERILL